MTIVNQVNKKSKAVAAEKPNTNSGDTPISSDATASNTDPILHAALHAASCGLSVIPLRADGSKSPRVNWTPYQRKAATAEDIRRWHGDEPLVGFGIIGGVSGIVGLDFDQKAAFAMFVARAEKHGLGQLVERVRAGYADTTPAGIRLLYRTSEPGTNTKLASAADGKTLVETRGQGGYSIVAPTLGKVHPSGRAYTRLSGDFDTIATLTPEEHDDLLALARSLDETVPEKPKPPKGEAGSVRPGDAWAETVDWPDILEPHGWTIADERDGVTYWTRPDKEGGVSATTNFADADLLKVFTTSTAFTAGETYTKFAAYTILKHEGDYSRAAAQLAKEGFGDDKHDKDVLLKALNDKHVVVKRGGTTFVATLNTDSVSNQTRVTYESFSSFRDFYSNIHVKVPKPLPDGGIKMVPTPIGKLWTTWEDRRTCDEIVFAPGKTLPEGSFNLWRGFGVKPQRGEWGKFREMIREVICAKNPIHFEYVINWMARAVQQPYKPGQVAIVMKGERGIGKGTFVDEFSPIFQPHFLQVTDPSLLTGEFNAVLETCCLWFLDEAVWAGDHGAESRLKGYITEQHITIRAMKTNHYQAPNCLHILMASNNDWVIPAGPKERRFFALDVNNAHQQDAEYFGAIRREMANGGREAMLYDLLERDISQFNVWAVPASKALDEQKLLTLGLSEQWWYDKLERGQLVNNAWPGEVSIDALHADYRTSLSLQGANRKGTVTMLGRFLNKMVPGIKKRRETWLIPSLEECRDAFDTLMKMETGWPPEEGDIGREGRAIEEAEAA